MRLKRRWRRAAGALPRVYAIGDVHGRLDLFEAMVERIRTDLIDRAPRSTRIVVLGDFVDRGPQSAQVVEVLMRLRREPGVIVLKGNHEAIMAAALAGDYAALDLWLAHGGAATLRSYGIDEAAIDVANGPALLRQARAAVGAEVRRWLAGLPTWLRIGRYYLVHAGIKPGVPLDKQGDEHRLWITDEFIRSEADHGAVVVHGHTIHPRVTMTRSRIAVDTGAYRTGRLSAVGLEEDEDGELAWILTVEGRPG